MLICWYEQAGDATERVNDLPSRQIMQRDEAISSHSMIKVVIKEPLD